MTDFDPYSEKIADICALIRQHGQCEAWELFKNAENGLEVLCAIVDAVRAEAKAAVPVGNQIGWYTIGTKDGKRNFEDPVLATNPFYISAHSEYEWLPVFAAPIAVAEQTGHADQN